MVIGTADTKKPLVADMDVDFCGLRIDMTEHSLDAADIRAVFIQVAGKAVAA